MEKENVMSRKINSCLIILILVLAFANTILISANSLNDTEEACYTPIESKSGHQLEKEDILPNELQTANSEPTVGYLPYTNNSLSYVTLYHPDEQVTWLFGDIPFNSTKYHIEITEYNNPDIIDMDLYVKFGSIPTISDYDYMSSTTDETESIDIEAPNDHEFGAMYISAYCVSGSGPIVLKAWYVLDNNGCWRSADLKTTPTNGEDPISWMDSVSSLDTNDFFKIFLYSGQMLNISVTVTSGWGFNHVDLYLYDAGRILFASNTTGPKFDIQFNFTIFESQNYYLVFRYAEVLNGTHTYSVVVTDENTDLDNRYDGPSVSEINITATYFGSMNTNDFNDYWFFYADSGETISIKVNISDTLDSPYYEASLYTSYGKPINDTYALNASGGSILYLNYSCAEYNSSEIESGAQNKIYLRLWNSARNEGIVNDTASYSISFVRLEWFSDDDRLITAPDYTTLGANDTSLKYNTLEGYHDVNDYFKITTDAGYNIKIYAKIYATPFPYLWGILYDDNGNLLAQDKNGTVTISYIAPYDGDYYFRMYEFASSNTNVSYEGVFRISYFIYTSLIDTSNNAFIDANLINPPKTINGDLNSYDVNDIYLIYVPSGYQIEIIQNYSASLDLFLFDELVEKVPNNSTCPTSFIFQNKELNTEAYFILINNSLGHILAVYTLDITIKQNDSDGDLTSAVHIPIINEEFINGTDSLNVTDINDYYYFFTNPNGEILILIEGVSGMVVQLIQNLSNIETQLVSYTIAGGNPVEIIYYANQSQTIDYKVYFRVCNPDGVFSGNYTWEITNIGQTTFNPLNLWIRLAICMGGILITFILVVVTVYLIKWKKEKKS